MLLHLIQPTQPRLELKPYSREGSNVFELICVFVFAYAKSQFSHNEAYFIVDVSIFNSCQMIFEPGREKNLCPGFLTRSDTNRAVQTQKIARCLKFLNEEGEGLYCCRYV